MSHLSLHVVLRFAAFLLLACVIDGGDLLGQQPQAVNSTAAIQATAAASAPAAPAAPKVTNITPSGNTPFGSANGGRSAAGGSAASTAGAANNVRSGNRASAYGGGYAHGARSQAQNGGSNTGGSYGAAGAYSTVPYSSSPYGAASGDSVFPGAVAPLPRWRDVGATPLVSPFRVNVDNTGTNAPATPVASSTPSVLQIPISDRADSSVNSSGGSSGKLTLGFAPIASAPDQVGQAIAKRLGKLPSLHFSRPVRVDIVGRTAYLRGSVATEHERDLVERVVRLEAAVDEIVNLIDVGGAESAEPPPPTPAANNG
jgi:hypothetical protein